MAPYVRATDTVTPMEDDILNHQFIAPDGVSLPVRAWSRRAAATA